MLFGLPWFAIVALASVIGGLFYAYKEKEMELEEKRYGKMRELQEMRKLIQNLKTRVEHLEAAAAQKSQTTSSPKENPLSDIEIEDEPEQENFNNPGKAGKVNS